MIRQWNSRALSTSSPSPRYDPAASAAEDHNHALKVKALGTIADELAKIDAGGKAFFEAKAKTASDELSGGTDPFQQGQVRLFGMPIRQFRE